MGNLIKSLLILLLAGVPFICQRAIGAEVIDLPDRSFQQNGNLYQDDLKRVVTITRGRATVYRLLSKISEQTGLLFIYDSKIVENDKRVVVEPGEYPLEDAVRIITGNRDLRIKIEENYILLYLPNADKAEPEIKKRDEIPSANNQTQEGGHFAISGAIKDRLTDEPIEFATISVNDKPYGTVSNLNGEFIFTLPDSLLDSHIKI